MSLNTESGSKNKNTFNIKNYLELIETLAKVEYKKLSCNHLVEYSELINIGTQVVHKLCCNAKPDAYNKSYISTAIKWAIRNEVRRRYKWYMLKNRGASSFIPDDEDPNAVREAVYKAILSIDEMAEADSPTQIRDHKRNPEEKLVFHELSEGIKEAIKKLPQRERELIECKFFKDKKLREIADEFNLSPSRISRIIQAGLNKIKKELVKQDLD